MSRTRDFADEALNTPFEPADATIVKDADIGTTVQAQGATLDSLEGLTLAAGDVLYATAADTLTKLAKGTADQVLAMNTGATAPEWVDPAGGSWVEIVPATTPTGGASLIAFTFDRTTYDEITIVFDKFKSSSDNDNLELYLQYNTTSYSTAHVLTDIIDEPGNAAGESTGGFCTFYFSSETVTPLKVATSTYYESSAGTGIINNNPTVFSDATLRNFTGCKLQMEGAETFQANGTYKMYGRVR